MSKAFINVGKFLEVEYMTGMWLFQTNIPYHKNFKKGGIYIMVENYWFKSVSVELGQYDIGVKSVESETKLSGFKWWLLL